MASTDGIVVLGDYAGAADGPAAVQVLLDLLPDPDTDSSSGAIAGGGLLDEINPAALAQIRAELLELQDNVT